jgi:hypothetical protein
MSEEQMKILENIQAMANALILETQKIMAIPVEEKTDKRRKKKKSTLTPEQRAQLLQGRYNTAFKK